MVDRILHIGYKLSGAYNKELLQRTAEVYIYKGKAAVVPHLMHAENMAAAEAETLAQQLNREMVKVNRQVLLQYAVVAVIFLVLVIAGWFSLSYIFAGVFAVPLFLFLFSLIKFVRRNNLQ